MHRFEYSNLGAFPGSRERLDGRIDLLKNGSVEPVVRVIQRYREQGRVSPRTRFGPILRSPSSRLA